MEAPEIESRQMFALLLSNCKQLDVEAVQMRLREEDFSDAILLRTEGRRSFQAQIVDPVYDPDRRKLILPDVPRLRPVRPRLKRRLPVTLSGRMTRLRDLRLGKELWFDAVVSDLSCSGVSVRFVRPSPLIQVGDNVRVELELSSGRVVATARIAWFQAGSPFAQAGLAFVSIDAGGHSILYNYVHNLQREDCALSLP